MPIAFLPENQALAVAVMSYNGRMEFACWPTTTPAPDLESLAGLFEESLEELWQRRATARRRPRAPDTAPQSLLNGSRTAASTPPYRTPLEELARAGRAAVDAGARVLHLHPYDDSDAETLEAEPCAAALRAVREARAGVPISLSTSAEIEPDPERWLSRSPHGPTSPSS